MAILIDGKQLAIDVRTRIKEATAKLPRRPGLAVILVGEDPASQVYVRNKEKDCIHCGFAGQTFRMEDCSEEELLALIERLNKNENIDGILVQLPLPKHINERRILEAIDPDKDVDAFHPANVGRMVVGKPVLLPCTPAGVMEMFHAYGIDLAGKHCVVVGRSNIVGKPMGLLMLREDATVTFCHSKTPDLAACTREADVLVVAAGRQGLISADMVKEGAVVIDVAMNRDPETGKFTGDVLFDEVEKKASYITPVPGGVGPMTRAILMQNVYAAARHHMGLDTEEE
ncbi:MAG: bifunctional methylenetetrahydrofolate dehydrogenase/methenyltetrahydrofolate cyclohydrolase FolD [Oscillospiraceae bacterium]|nr:bifunctional methylenetetrahydrofolate dehydrogenase/methenyltetrahydrofolate cyclohydrolase FolD [Oscillospiraceae bacterium]